jgi:CPA2 family monovalent cation:H+ antiporter-2
MTGLATATGAGADAQFDVLSSLAIILCVAAVTTVVFQKIRQPVVLGYLLAGLIVGPHMPVPLFANPETAHLFSDLGVILLMFALGLEFTLGKLARVGPTAGLVAVIECSLMVGLGYTATGFFGWSTIERLFAGAMVAISSTTIIVKAFAENGITGSLRERVYGILIVEDVIAILLLAVLTTVASGAGLSAGALGWTVARLGAFLVGMLVVGMLVVPRVVRAVVRIGRRETTAVGCVGICFASALLARHFGYSVALGAFIGGVLVAESGQAPAVEPVIEPVKDVFAAVFFVSVGMRIDPQLVLQNLVPVAVLTAVVLLGKIVGVSLGAFVAGHGVRSSIQSGMSLAQIGEFSFIIVGVGVSLGVVRESLYPIAVAISALTTLSTPWLVRGSGSIASVVDRRLPHALQTYAALYGSWVRQLGVPARRTPSFARLRRLAGALVLDMAVIAALLVAGALEWTRATHALAAFLPVLLPVLAPARPELARALVALALIVLEMPFVVGAVRVARALGVALAAEALPLAPAGQVDLAAAPRRALRVTVQIAILLVVGLPLVAIGQPFWPHLPWAGFLLLALAAMAVPLWRGASNLHGHVRAGAEVILEALARQGRDAASGTGTGTGVAPDLSRLVPGLGDATAVHLSPEHFGAGKTLGQTNLRGRTGASVIAIERAGAPVLPTAGARLQAGDTLVVTGTADSVEAARQWLTAGPPRPPARRPPATADLSQPQAEADASEPQAEADASQPQAEADVSQPQAEADVSQPQD